MSVWVLVAVWLGAAIVLGVALALLWRWPRTRLARISKHRAAPARRPRSGAAHRIRRFATTRPRLAIVLTGAASAGLGWQLGGPVAGAVGALYAMVAVRGWQRREARRAVEQVRLEVLAAVDAAASELRAGLVPDLAPIGRAAALANAGWARAGDARVGGVPGAVGPTDVAVSAALARLEAAYRVSEALGASLANAFSLVDADLRGQQQLRQKVRANTAAARTTSMVLVGLPVAGPLLGMGIGIDPVDQLLHTPVGGACTVMAALLQCGGLAWTGWLIRAVTAGVG